MRINLFDIKDGEFAASLSWDLPLPQKGDKIMVHGLDGVFGVEVDSRVFDDERQDAVSIMVKYL
jgi:hypothetical protein